MLSMNRKGQALVEYVLIIGVITVIAISLVTLFGGYLKDAITKASCPLVGLEYEKGATPGEGKCVESEDIFK